VCLDVALDYPSPQVFGAGGMILLPFVILAYVDEMKVLAGFCLAFHFLDTDLTDPRAGICAQLLKGG
jgi:hypothetical protein